MHDYRFQLPSLEVFYYLPPPSRNSLEHMSNCCLCPSPFEVGVGPEAGPQKIRAWGPGLEGGMVGKSADFVAESIGTDVGVLGKDC